VALAKEFELQLGWMLDWALELRLLLALVRAKMRLYFLGLGRECFGAWLKGL
jgi:hypothetical protein